MCCNRFWFSFFYFGIFCWAAYNDLNIGQELSNTGLFYAKLPWIVAVALSWVVAVVCVFTGTKKKNKQANSLNLDIAIWMVLCL